MNYYILDGHLPKTVDFLTWGQWFQTADRVIVKTQVAPDCEVSTVFLGLDHNFGLEGDPVLFETLVFGGDLDGTMNRYTTWEAAETGHEEMVKECAIARAEGGAA